MINETKQVVKGATRPDQPSLFDQMSQVWGPIIPLELGVLICLKQYYKYTLKIVKKESEKRFLKKSIYNINQEILQMFAALPNKDDLDFKSLEPLIFEDPQLRSRYGALAMLEHRNTSAGLDFEGLNQSELEKAQLVVESLLDIILDKITSEKSKATKKIWYNLMAKINEDLADIDYLVQNPSQRVIRKSQISTIPLEQARSQAQKQSGSTWEYYLRCLVDFDSRAEYESLLAAKGSWTDWSSKEEFIEGATNPSDKPGKFVLHFLHDLEETRI